jgi:hypothetical protein
VNLFLNKCVFLDLWWNQSLLFLIKFLKPIPVIYVHCDSWSLIEMSQSDMCNRKSRYIHCIYNTIKYLLSNRIIFIDYVKSKENIVDSLIKGLSRKLVYNFIKGNNLKAFNIWKSIMMVTLPSWLEIPRSRFK